MEFSDFFWFKRSSGKDPLPEENFPVLHDGEYREADIVPSENSQFISGEIAAILDLLEKPEDAASSVIIRGRQGLPALTITKEIRVDYLERLLSGFGMNKAGQIKYEGTIYSDKVISKINAFQFPGGTLFFESEDEFVESIWLSFKEPSTGKLETLISALYSLGEECDMVLADWGVLEMVDLKNKKQIRDYLIKMN